MKDNAPQPSRSRLGIRDLFWLTLVVALLLVMLGQRWSWIDENQRLRDHLDAARQQQQAYVAEKEAVLQSLEDLMAQQATLTNSERSNPAGPETVDGSQ